MPAVIANARTLPQRSLTSGGSWLGACMHATLAKWPFVTPSNRFSTRDATSDLRIQSLGWSSHSLAASKFSCVIRYKPSCRSYLNDSSRVTTQGDRWTENFAWCLLEIVMVLRRIDIRVPVLCLT